MATAEVSAEQRFVLSGVDWKAYVGLGDLLGERHVRLTYDGRNLELMTLSSEHENNKKLLARFVETLTEELEIDIASYGSMTFRREDLERGMEPDECYWIANEPLVRGRTDLDLAVDPPPDLALEIEISRSALDRMAIHAKLRIPEVWCWDGETLRVNLLGRDGQYTQSPRSRAFPFLPLDVLAQFLKGGAGLSETQLVRKFRLWVREQVRQGWPASPPPASGNGN
jgi:Uma2 family endonuclease